MSKWLAGLILGFAAVANAGMAKSEDTVRNYGSTEVAPVVASEAAPAAVVAFHHRKACCGGSGFSSAYNAYSTYQPNPYYASGYAGSYYGVGANPSYYRGAGA